ncbi:MAG: aspartyl/asparaginyl beta-hydroxylase domain-containing protein [Hyphomicrobiales bacterium]
MNKSVKRAAKGFIVLAPLTYFFPEVMLFYFVCGIYDVARNKDLSLSTIERYFLGNGIFTWLLSPLNIVLDILSLPYINKGVYKLEDLPAPYQTEIKNLITATHQQNLVAKLQAAAEDEKRSMFFFKWYSANVDTIVDIPAFHEKYKYITTIGVSVFNKRQSTSKHFGPLRASLRVLYNINDMDDDSAYIEVGDVKSYWRKDKLFIFDDTLQHQSFNESDKARYCLFVDIVRPSLLPVVLSGFLDVVRYIFAAGANSMFYNNWKVIRK